MTSRPATMRISTTVAGAAVAACALLAIGSAAAGAAQEAAPPPADVGSNAPATAAPNPIYRPGFLDALGRLLGEGASKFQSDLQGAHETLDKLGGHARDAAKDATGAVMGLPNARVVSGRERCAAAQNGAPDCQAAAATVCRGKGFQTGKSLDTQSEQKCPARVLLSGRAPNHAECPTEIFVTRAMCQ